MKKSITLHLTDTEAILIATGLMIYQDDAEGPDADLAGDVRQRITELLKEPTTEEIMATCRQKTGNFVAAEYIRENEPVRRLPCGMIGSAIRYGEQDGD